MSYRSRRSLYAVAFNGTGGLKLFDVDDFPREKTFSFIMCDVILPFNQGDQVPSDHELLSSGFYLTEDRYYARNSSSNIEEYLKFTPEANFTIVATKDEASLVIIYRPQIFFINIGGPAYKFISDEYIYYYDTGK